MNTSGVLPLHELPINRAEFRQLVNTGRLRRLRRGWYATEFADESVCEAVSAGGVLSCISALRTHGVWVPEHAKRLHVRGNSQAHRRPNTLCRMYARPQPEEAAVDDVPMALRHAARCLDDEGVVVVCDSILNQGLMSRVDIESALASAPKRLRTLLDLCDPGAESGTETLVRLRLRRHRLPVRTQVRIAGVGRVDLLIGTLIIEVDGKAFHTGVERFEADRERDRRASELGYTTIRLTYRQVVHDWAAVESDLVSIARRLHVA